MEDTEKYSERVRNILYGDIFQRDPEKDPVRIAYEIAAEMHSGQKRKGKDEIDYITHPLQVYDMVKKCIGDDDVRDKDVTLAVALLHDAVEDYGKGKAIDKEDAVQEAIRNIENAFITRSTNGKFTNFEFSQKLMDSLSVLSNPTESMDDEAKRRHQVGVAKSAPANIKLIKICDQAMNLVSNIEESTKWNYRKFINYTNKATAVAKAAYTSNDKNDPYYNAVNTAWKVYEKISHEELDILKSTKKRYDQVAKEEDEITENVEARAVSLPSKHQIASFLLDNIIESARKDVNKHSSMAI